MRLSNAKLVLPDTVRHGSLDIENGLIAALGEADDGTDCEGDFLIPGIIDLHTDNLERQVLPRSNARWPSRSALLSHDAQCAAAGITTVFDALCLGDIGFEKARNQTFEDGVADLRALNAAGMLKTEHFLHLRCELPAPEMPEMLERAIDDPLVRLISVMDHSPGLGQYADISRYRQMREKEGFSETEIDEVVTALQANHRAHHVPNRALVLEAVRARNIPIASHDDRTPEEIARNHAEGIDISEFPVSLAAARAARGLGMRTIAGAPNIVRGGSHSGNVAVTDLIREDLLDALASDYVPAAMLEAAFAAFRQKLLDLPAAIALITSGPAAMVALDDRGRIAPGLAADLVQVRLFEDIPVIRAVWRRGRRIG
jgi:alpha-D-ribose 1-methylphosphonate 5-triphosphate diphosphatase